MPVPKISVVIPAYNAARYLREAIASIQAQTFPDFEIIAVNDGSTDRSKEILDGLAGRDPRLRVISRPNTGIVGALNDGLAAARGEFIARMDADDWSFPERFNCQYKFLLDHPECVAVGSSVIFMDDRGAPVENCPRDSEATKVEAALMGGDGGALIHPAMFFRKNALDRIGGYRPFAQYVEDLDLFLRLSRLGRLTNLPEPLLFYRVHASSINFTKNRNRFDVWKQVMSEAHATRGLPFAPPSLDKAETFNPSFGANHQRWAMTSLGFGRRSVAIRHGLLACRLAPREPASWKALAYALRAPLPARSPNLPAIPSNAP